jgi:hypothetical protein
VIRRNKAGIIMHQPSPSGVWLDRICSVSRNSVTSRSAAYASIAASTRASPCGHVCNGEGGVSGEKR